MTSTDAVLIAELVRALDRETVLRGAVRRIVDSALTLTAADDGAVSLRWAPGQWEVGAASSAAVAAVEVGQYRASEGPALTAAQIRHTVLVADVSGDGRWPTWEALVTSCRIRAAIATCLHTPRKNLGTVSVYAQAPGHFTPGHAHDLRTLAEQASIFLEKLWHQAEQRPGLSGHTVIGQAQSLLMERYGLDAGTALDVLRQHADGNRADLTDVAGRLLATCGDPTGRVKAGRTSWIGASENRSL